MTTIAVVLGSTRPGRNGEAVARWVMEQAAARTDARFELLDLATGFVDFHEFRPGDHQRRALTATLDQLVACSTALAPLRSAAQDHAA